MSGDEPVAGVPTRGLSAAQAVFVERRFPGARLREDLSWGLVDSTVLHLRAGGGDVIVKAGGPDNHHIGREIRAHREAAAALAEAGHGPRLIACDAAANIVVTRYLPGRLVEETAAERDPDVYAQAGRILRFLHDQPLPPSQERVSRTLDRKQTAKALKWLRAPHAIAAPDARRAREILASYEPADVTVVPSHGDYSPRNWLVDGARVQVIDFGRFGYRPAIQDVTRLAMRQWLSVPGARDAFAAGYGADLAAETPAWRINLLREAVATAAWAHKVGDRAFEAEGVRAVSEALARFQADGF